MPKYVSIKVRAERLARLEERSAGLQEKLLSGGIPPCWRAFILEQTEAVWEEQDGLEALRWGE